MRDQNDLGYLIENPCPGTSIYTFGETGFLVPSETTSDKISAFDNCVLLGILYNDVLFTLLGLTPYLATQSTIYRYIRIKHALTECGTYVAIPIVSTIMGSNESNGIQFIHYEDEDKERLEEEEQQIESDPDEKVLWPSTLQTIPGRVAVIPEVLVPIVDTPTFDLVLPELVIPEPGNYDLEFDEPVSNGEGVPTRIYYKGYSVGNNFNWSTYYGDDESQEWHNWKDKQLSDNPGSEILESNFTADGPPVLFQGSGWVTYGSGFITLSQIETIDYYSQISASLDSLSQFEYPTITVPQPLSLDL